MSTNPSQNRGAAGEMWRHTLSRIPTLFGQLVYLSSLRNQESGQYEHHGLAQMIGPEQAVELLVRSHRQVFQDWLGMSLEQQKADLQEYLDDLPGDKLSVLTTWSTVAPYRSLPPPSAEEVERELYITDMGLIVELLKRACGGA